MEKESESKIKTITTGLYPVHLEMMDHLRGYESRSSYVRRLIEQAYAEAAKKEQ